MIIEITKYKPVEGLTHEELLQASKNFDRDYCSKCIGLIRRQFVKTDSGYMDIFTWKSKEDVERIQATFMQDKDALEFARHIDTESLTMSNHELLDSFSG